MLGFLIWFLVCIAVLAVVVIAGRWLMSLAGITLPQPLTLCLGIILFIIVLVAFWHFAGADAFSTGQSLRRPL
jgi:hypothetical protein